MEPVKITTIWISPFATFRCIYRCDRPGCFNKQQQFDATPSDKTEYDKLCGQARFSKTRILGDFFSTVIPLRTRPVKAYSVLLLRSGLTADGLSSVRYTVGPDRSAEYIRGTRAARYNLGGKTQSKIIEINDLKLLCFSFS